MNWKTKPFDRQIAPDTGGCVHVSKMAQTLLFVLSLDRNVVLEEINIYSR